MAFITRDAIVDNQLKKIGLSLDAVINFSPDRQHDQFSLIIGGEAANDKYKKLPIDTADLDSNYSFEALMRMSLSPIAIIPRGFVDSNGVNGICFHGLYCLRASCEEMPKRKGKKRGNYRLDPKNTYTMARRHDDFFLNQITVKESDLSKNTWDLLWEFLRKRHNLKSSIAYILADVPAVTFHRIHKAKPKPKKETLLKLGVILQLSLEEMITWLGTADLAFNPSDKRDMLIKKCFQEGVLNPLDINKVLYAEHLQEMKFGDFGRLTPH